MLQHGELGGLAGDVQGDEAGEQHGRHAPRAPADRVWRGRRVGTLQEVGCGGRGELLREETERAAREELDLDALETLAGRLHRGGVAVPLRCAGVEDETPAARRSGLDAREGDLERLAKGVGG